MAILLLMLLGLFASAQTSKYPSSELLLAAITEEGDQPQENIEAKDGLLGPKGLIKEDFTLPLVAALILLVSLGACVCLASGDKKKNQEKARMEPEEYAGFVRLDA